MGEEAAPFSAALATMGDRDVIVTSDTRYTGDVWQGQLSTRPSGDVGARDPDDPYCWYEYIAAILALEWGIVHILAAWLVSSPAFANNLYGAFKGLYDAMDEKA